MQSLNKVFTDGNLVDVTIRMWTGERMLQPEDLGLDGARISDAFKLGKKALIPRDVTTNFRKLDQRARMCLTKHSFPFAFGGSRFVPKKTFLKFAEEFEYLRTLYQGEVDSLIDNYDRYRIEMRAQYVKAAKEAHRRILSGSIRKIELDMDEFVNKFLERVESFYPAKEELAAKFSMDYMVFQVSLPDLTQASYDDLIEEDEKIQLLQRAKQAELQRRVRAFVDNTVLSLREKARTVLHRLDSSIASCSKVTKASLNAVTNMIDDYISLDIIGDEDFIKQMIAFRDNHLRHMNDNRLRMNRDYALSMCKELRRLVAMAEDKAAINALSESYKKKLEI